jgi:phage terminase small subunit
VAKVKTKHEQKVALFIEYYLTNGHNIAAAYVSAGWKASTTQVASTEGAKILKKPDVARTIAQRLAEALEKAKCTTDEVLLSAARQIKFDPRKLVDENDAPKKLKDLDEDTALALEVVEFKGVKVRVNRGAAREQYMKHLGLFEKDNRQKPAAVVHMPGVKSVRFEPLRGRKPA